MGSLPIVIICAKFCRYRANSFWGQTPENWLFSLTWKATFTTDRALPSSAVMKFVRLCFAHHNTMVSSLARYGFMYVCFSSPVGRNMLRCTQRYSFSVKHLLCCNSVRCTVELCVRKRVTVDQVRTADLVYECIMFRGGLLSLTNAFTVGDFTGIMYYLFTSWLHSVFCLSDCLSVCLSASFSLSLSLSLSPFLSTCFFVLGVRFI